MIVRETDHLLGIVGADMVPPAASGTEPPMTAMTVCAYCLRRDGRWLTFIEFLYSTNKAVLSPEDERNIYPIPTPVTDDTDALWELLRNTTRTAVSQMAHKIAPIEFHELRVDGTPDKLDVMLATSNDPFLRTLATANPKS